MEGTKVIYFDIETEIEAVQKDFINQTYLYKLKGVIDLVEYQNFMIITDELINEVNHLLNNANDENNKNDDKLDTDRNLDNINSLGTNLDVDNSNIDKNVETDAIKEIEKIIENETKNTKKLKVKK